MTKVYVIFHCEVWEYEPHLVDEAIFHTASSLEKAEKYMEDIHIEENTWWKVVEMVVDSIDDFLKDGPFHFYGNKGKKLKKSPYKRVLKALLG